MYGISKYKYNFYDNILRFYHVLQHKYDLWVRLKPGENYSEFLEPHMIEALNNLKINFDDNTIPSYKSISKYDLIVGEQSTILLESIINNIPIICFSYYDGPLANLTFFFKDNLGAITYRHDDDINSMIDKALSSEYIKKIRNNLKKKESFWFHKLDGKASERVANICLYAHKKNRG